MSSAGAHRTPDRFISFICVLLCLPNLSQCLCGSCIEKDPALARRFQAVAVDEPSEQQTLRILRALQQKYEAFHKIRYEDEALQAAVRLANRFGNSSV